MQDIENELFIIKINIYKNNKGYIAHQEGKIYFSWGTSKQFKPINKIKNNKVYMKYLFIFIYMINHLLIFKIIRLKLII